MIHDNWIRLPDQFSHTDTLGYFWNKKMDTLQFRWIAVQNAFNFLGCFFSVFGIIRMTNAAYFLYKNESYDKTPLTKDQKNYFWSQIGRGFIETMGMGFLFVVPDLIMTVHRSHPGCTVS